MYVDRKLQTFSLEPIMALHGGTRAVFSIFVHWDSGDKTVKKSGRFTRYFHYQSINCGKKKARMKKNKSFALLFLKGMFYCYSISRQSKETLNYTRTLNFNSCLNIMIALFSARHCSLDGCEARYGFFYFDRAVGVIYTRQDGLKITSIN